MGTLKSLSVTSGKNRNERIYKESVQRWLEGVASDGAGELGRSGGFTLLEMILAVTILSVVMIVAFYSFNAAVRSWIAGNDYINGITHADYVLEQIAMGLRSAYYPDTGRVEGTYGMTLIDDGEGPMARDRLTWVKIGSALVGADADYADTPHRIEIAVLDEGDTKADYDGGGFAFRAWRVALQPEDFESEDVPFHVISPRVSGMNFRMLDPDKEEDDLTSELNWLDTWETADQTNRLPRAIEVTLYLSASEQGGEAIPVRRVVSVPLAELAWNPRSQDDGKRDGRDAARRGQSGRQPPQRGQSGRQPPRGGQTGQQVPGGGGQRSPNQPPNRPAGGLP